MSEQETKIRDFGFASSMGRWLLMLPLLGKPRGCLRQLAYTLMHAIPPVVVGWPAGQLYRMYRCRTTVHSMLLIRPARLLTPA